jgi:GNAT superfamily N-acetyltransferase
MELGSEPSDDSFLMFETVFRKHGDLPEVLNFSVQLRRYPFDSDIAGPMLAELKGFIAQPGYIPEPDDGWYFDVFDMRSQHAMNAFHVLADEHALLKKALDTPDLDYLGAVAHLERVWVSEPMRGRCIALRLMREANQVLARNGLLVVLKAHPDGEKVPNAACLKLASYYQSDKRLGLRAVSKRKFPGWLVAIWEEPIVNTDDQLFLHEDDETVELDA